MIVFIALACALLIFVLVLAIFFMRRRQRQMMSTAADPSLAVAQELRPVSGSVVNSSSTQNLLQASSSSISVTTNAG